MVASEVDLRLWVVPALLVLALVTLAWRARPHAALAPWLRAQGWTLVRARLLHDLNRGVRVISREDGDTDVLVVLRDASGTMSERQVRQTERLGAPPVFVWVD